MVIIVGDFNGQVGRTSNVFDRYHGSNGYGTRDTDGTKILDFCAAADMAINTFFTKRPTHLITYSSGESST